MYHNSPPVDYVAIIGGILSLIVLITFFVMAFRLKKIIQYLRSTNGIIRARATKEGMFQVKCTYCDAMNDIVNDYRPVLCWSCGKDLKKTIELEQASQTDKTDKA
jgi:hypothetical protein